MKTTINCFVPYGNAECVKATVAGLRECPMVTKIFLLASEENVEAIEGTEVLHIDTLTSSKTMKAIAAAADSDFMLLYTKNDTLVPGYFALERFVRLATDSKAGMMYADSYLVVDGKKSNAPVIDYQFGSLRDDFNFGSVLFFNTADFKKAAEGITADFKAAGLYDLRLRISRIAPIVHINEYLYTDIAAPKTEDGESHFSYVDPKNRGVQIEMEEACTDHLKAIGGYLEPKFDTINFDKGDFEYEASVIIPVRNRVRTIRDAIRSVLSQKTDFPFNLIIVDNHSTDGTSEAIEEFTSDPRVVHVIPERDDLGIGGCWNMGVENPKCGKFAVQLDSDDVYSDENTLAKMVKAFYDQNCGMVVGTYMLTDIDMNMIPPGVIDHKEWTPENGRNNALRINGLGAPRAFYTPMLREIHVPNTSYGEDYALGLAFSRRNQIGRVYDVVYNCRRWEDNSDHALDVVKTNNNNLYKDRIRTWELEARVAMNKAK
ncbi:MAG: glycosyltransferase family 2 protein [Muribaculaceae bacterium]|nr:glycosyltransferase family 2 protein [Muribaculaceae bacterium]